MIQKRSSFAYVYLTININNKAENSLRRGAIIVYSEIKKKELEKMLNLLIMYYRRQKQLTRWHAYKDLI